MPPDQGVRGSASARIVPEAVIWAGAPDAVVEIRELERPSSLVGDPGHAEAVCVRDPFVDQEAEQVLSIPRLEALVVDTHEPPRTRARGRCALAARVAESARGVVDYREACRAK
jgi:hypothetical protein